MHDAGIDPTTFPVASRHSDEALFCLTPAGLVRILNEVGMSIASMILLNLFCRMASKFTLEKICAIEKCHIQSGMFNQQLDCWISHTSGTT